MYLSITFQEEYKRLDKLCKDYLSSEKGVSSYIEQMEATAIQNRRYVLTWDEDYKQLKHVRWVRNKLAHEVGTLNSDFCTEEDLEWVQEFTNRILRGTDPFSTARKAKQTQETRNRSIAKSQKQTSYEVLQPNYKPLPNNNRREPSLWEKIIDFLDNLFS